MCSELSPWEVADSWSRTNSSWVGWVWSALHLQEALLANLIATLLFLNAYFVKVFFYLQQFLRSCWGAVLYFPLPTNWRFKCYPCMLQILIIIQMVKQSRFNGNFPKINATFLKEKCYLNPFLLYLLFLLLLERPTHLGRSVMQYLVVSSYRHRKWADSISCHLLLSKGCVTALWLHRAREDAEHPIPKPFAAKP